MTSAIQIVRVLAGTGARPDVMSDSVLCTCRSPHGVRPRYGQRSEFTTSALPGVRCVTYGGPPVTRGTRMAHDHVRPAGRPTNEDDDQPRRPARRPATPVAPPVWRRLSWRCSAPGRWPPSAWSRRASSASSPPTARWPGSRPPCSRPAPSGSPSPRPRPRPVTGPPRPTARPRDRGPQTTAPLGPAIVPAVGNDGGGTVLATAGPGTPAAPVPTPTPHAGDRPAAAPT